MCATLEVGRCSRPHCRCLRRAGCLALLRMPASCWRLPSASALAVGGMKWDDKGEQRYGVIGIYRARDGVWELQVRADVW